MLPRVEGAQVGSSVVQAGLGLLGSSEVFPDHGPNLRHPASHLLNVLDDGAVGGRMALPGGPGDVEQPCRSSALK